MALAKVRGFSGVFSVSQYVAVKKGFIGKAWSYGDARKSEWYWISSILWTLRNTAYGWNYLLEEIAEDSKYNFYKQIKIFEDNFLNLLSFYL